MRCRSGFCAGTCGSPIQRDTLGVAWISNPFTQRRWEGRLSPAHAARGLGPRMPVSSRFRAFFIPAMLLGAPRHPAAHADRFHATQVLCYLVFIDSRHWSPARVRSDAVGDLLRGCLRSLQPVRGFRARAGPCPPVPVRAAARERPPPDGSAPAETVDPTTILLEEDGVVLDRSTAALRIVAGLGGVWSLVAVLRASFPGRFATRSTTGWRETATPGSASGTPAGCPTPEERAVFLA